MRNTTPLEEDEQKAFVQWLDIKGLLFTAIPNSTFAGAYSGGAKKKNWGALKKLKDMGMRPGLPDLIISVPAGLAFVEMKRKRGSVTSEAQKKWIHALNRVHNVEARVCFGAEEAIEFITSLLPRERQAVASGSQRSGNERVPRVSPVL